MGCGVAVGIISIILFFFMAFQSCAAGVSNTLSGSGGNSGTLGFIISVIFLIGGIIGIATKNSKSGAFTTGGLYLLGGIIGLVAYDPANFLGIWIALSFVFAAVFLISGFLAQGNFERR